MGEMGLEGLYPAVDFVLNVFERTYRGVLQPGAITKRVAGHAFPFTKIVVLVNNVDDRADIESLMAPLLASGEVSEFHYVADRLNEALRLAALNRKDIEKTIHYTDCSLVAVFLPGSPYLLYSDADVFMDGPSDWITASLMLMKNDERIAVANPNWRNSSLATESRELKDEFGIGYGFSDQLYLLRREEFARPIYNYWAPISLRFPLAHIAPVFEQKVDAYMRCGKRLRATYIGMTYVHDSDEGATYQAEGTILRMKRFLMNAVVRVCRLVPGDDPRFSI
jgi:hypothetical protein